MKGADVADKKTETAFQPSLSWRACVALIAAVTTLALDYVTKVFVKNTLMVTGENVPVIPGILSFRFVANKGAAFSLGEGMGLIFVAFAALVIVAILQYLTRTCLLYTSPGHAGVPPHVEDVTIGLEVMAATLGAHAGVAEVGLRGVGEPGIGALLMEQSDDRVERVVVHDLLATVGAGEGRNRHAPVALTGDAPIGTLLHHGADAVDGVLGIPGHVVAHLVERCLLYTSRCV